MKTIACLGLAVVAGACLMVACAGSSVGKGDNIFAVHYSSGIYSYQIYRPQVEEGYARAACIEMASRFAGLMPRPQVDIMTWADSDNNDLLSLGEMETYLEAYGGLSIETYHVQTGLPPQVGEDFAGYTDAGLLPLIPLNDGHMYVLAGYSQPIVGNQTTTALVLDPASPGSGRGKAKSLSFDKLQDKMCSDCGPDFCFYYGLVESATFNKRDRDHGNSLAKVCGSRGPGGGELVDRVQYGCSGGDDPWRPRTLEDTVRMCAADALINQNGGTGLAAAGAWFGSQFADGYLGDVIPTSLMNWEPGFGSFHESPGPSIYMYVVELRTSDPQHPDEVVGGIGLRKGHLADSVVFTGLFPFLTSGQGACEPGAVSKSAIERFYGSPATAFVSEQDSHVSLPLCDMPNWLVHDSTGAEVIIDFWGKILLWVNDSERGRHLVDSGRRFEEAEIGSLTPEETPISELVGNSPNPFNPGTRIDFAPHTAGEVTVEIFNSVGQKVRTLCHEYRSSGPQSVYWDGRDESGCAVSSGVYFCKLTTASHSETKKMALVK